MTEEHGSSCDHGSSCRHRQLRSESGDVETDSNGAAGATNTGVSSSARGGVSVPTSQVKDVPSRIDTEEKIDLSAETAKNGGPGHGEEDRRIDADANCGGRSEDKTTDATAAASNSDVSEECWTSNIASLPSKVKEIR